jgi:hypothetical protein
VRGHSRDVRVSPLGEHVVHPVGEALAVRKLYLLFTNTELQE